ncbi:polysaccharide biosynthesis protein [Frigidibacter oleivorans]|uniref:hypothetical protein n=1 Tax=Frigidibacter oleivorans TaxID=2487129 RepID=UPI000F8ECD9C|nr:hypothetical protein [Frigidibacter oleivorans]
MLALLSATIIARYFDRETSGVVFFLTGLITLSVSVSTLGLSTASSYYYSRNLRRGRHVRNWQIFNLSMLVAIFPSIIVALMALLMEEARQSFGGIAVLVLAVSCFMGAMRQMAKMIFTIEDRRDISILHENITYNALLIVMIVGLSLIHSGSALQGSAGLAAVLVASVGSGVFAVWHTLRKLRMRRQVPLRPACRPASTSPSCPRSPCRPWWPRAAPSP